MSFIEQLKN